VKRFEASHDEEVERIFNNYECENKCDRHFYSYITIGQVIYDEQEEKLTVAESVEV